MKSRWRAACWLGMTLAALLASGTAAAITPRFEVLGVEQGLPSALVHEISQDRQGYLWFGTGDGLVRYDGLDMRIYQHDRDDPLSLPANNVQALMIDSADRIWVATLDSGLSMLDSRREGFVHFRHDPDDPGSLGSDSLWDIVEGPDGAIWLATWGAGVYRLDPDTGEFSSLRHRPDDPDSIPGDDISALAFDADGRLWVSTYGEGLAQALDDGSFRRYRHRPGDSNSPAGDAFHSIRVDSRGELWFSGQSALVQRRLDGGFHNHFVDLAGATDIIEDQGGQRWVLTRDGLYFWSALDQRPVSVPRRPGVLGTLPSERMWQAYRDHEGGLWFGTLDGGIARLRPDWSQFTLHQHDPQSANSLPESPVRGLGATGDGRLMVATFSAGLVILDPHSAEVETVPSSPRFDLPPVPELLPQTRVWTALEDRRGRQWVGHHSGVSMRESEAAPWTHWMGLHVPEPQLLAGFVDLLWEAPDGSIWASSHGHGLHQFSAEGELLHIYPAGVADGGGAAGARPRQILADAEGAMWIAHDYGLDRFDPRSARFESLLPDGPRPLFGVALTGNDVLWVLGYGVLDQYRIEDAGLRPLAHYAGDAGLPAVEAGGLLRDAQDRLWYATGRGLVNFDPASGRAQRYGLTEGLPVQQVSDRVPLRSAEGRLYFGTVNGVLGFDPAELKANPVAPPLHLQSLSVRRGEALIDLQPEEGIVHLQHGDRDLTARVRALSFVDPRANRYLMRLQGYDSDWQQVDARGERVFGLLAAGHYTLQIRGSNNAGVFSSEDISLRLQMPVPPWRTPLMLALYALFVVLVAIAALRAYRQRIRRRHELLLAEERARWAESSSQAKSHFLASFSHEVRTPMTGLLGMTELLLRTELSPRQSSYAHNLRRSGRMLLRLMDDILDLSRIESGRLEMCQESVALRGLLEELRDMYGPLAEQEGLEFRLEIAPEFPELVTGDGLRLRQVLENLLRNAIKFTARGSVVLRGALDSQGHIVLEVEDTGPGISEQARARLFQPFSQADGSILKRYGGSGLGLVICRELAQRMDGRIELQSEPGRGTLLRLVLPLPLQSRREGVRSDTGRALVVEDDSGAAALLVELLADEGVSADIAANGIAAISAYASADYRWVFMDLDLPGLDGFEIARLVRREEAAKGRTPVQIVAVTARTGAGLGERCRAAGMDDLFPKPVSPAVLRRVLAGEL